MGERWRVIFIDLASKTKRKMMRSKASWIWTKHWILNPLGDALQNINDSKQVNSSPEVDLSKPLDDTELKLDISE